jgi:hypothetical protein
MSELNTATTNYWTSTQAFALAAVSPVLGVRGGMLIRRATARTATSQVVTAPEQASGTLPASFGSTARRPSAPELETGGRRTGRASA